MRRPTPDARQQRLAGLLASQGRLSPEALWPRAARLAPWLDALAAPGGLATLCRRQRRARGWTQAEVATRSGLSQAQVALLESARRRGALRTWRALGAALEIPAAVIAAAWLQRELGALALEAGAVLLATAAEATDRA